MSSSLQKAKLRKSNSRTIVVPGSNTSNSGSLPSTPPTVQTPPAMANKENVTRKLKPQQPAQAVDPDRSLSPQQQRLRALAAANSLDSSTPISSEFVASTSEPFMDESVSSEDSLDDIDARLAAASHNAAMGYGQQQEQEEEDMGEFAGALTEDRLRDMTGFEDLDLVTGTELKLDATKDSLGILGDTMPQLQSLRLGHSKIPTLRDLGTKLVRLQYLWVNNAQVKDLNGVQFCHQLKELYVSYNSISLLGPLNGLLNLEVLDLEGNDINNVSEVEALNGLESLRELTLSGNPFVFGSFSSVAQYRSKVLSVLDAERCPALESLDDATIDRNAVAADKPDTPPVAGSSRFVDPLADHLGAELAVVSSSIKVNADAGIEKMVEEQHRNLCSRQSTSVAGARRRPPSTVGARVGTTGHPSSAPTIAEQIEIAPKTQKPHSSGEVPSPTKQTGASPGSSASTLTRGSGVFSGSLVKNLRARRQGSGAALNVSRRTVDAEPTASLTVDGPQDRALPNTRTPTPECEEPLDEDGYSADVPTRSASQRMNSEGRGEDDALFGADDADRDPLAGDDEDTNDLDALRAENAALPKLDFMGKYKDLIASTAAEEEEDERSRSVSSFSDVDGSKQRRPSQGGVRTRAPGPMTEAEVLERAKDFKIRSAQKLQQEMLEDATGGQTGGYESLSFGDVGGNLEGVL